MIRNRRVTSKGFSIILIIAIGAIIATFGWIAYATWQQSVDDSNFTLTLPFVKHKAKNVNTDAEVNTNTADDKTLADADLASKWAVFTDDVYGVSVQYPSTWKSKTIQKQNDESGSSSVGVAWFFRPDTDGEVAAGSPTVYLKFLANPENKTLGQLLDQDYENCVASPGGSEEICINSKAISTWTSSALSGHAALRSGLLRLAAGSPSSIIEKDFLYVKTDDGYIVLDSFPEPEYETVIDKIISSLQFVDAQKTWVTYENKELGFSFQYPSFLGTAIFTENMGDTGRTFSLLVSSAATTLEHREQAALELGCMTKDYTAGTEGSFFTTQGYILDKGGYYNTFVAGRDYIDYPLQPFKVMSVSGQTVLLLNQESLVYQRYKDPNSSYPPTLGETRLGALANFSKKSDYRGMGILDYNTALVPSSTFEAILSTFTFIQ